jgi:hypothetical protein
MRIPKIILSYTFYLYIYCHVCTNSKCTFTLTQSRQRAQSQVSLRKKLIRTSSEDKNTELKKSSTMTSFRPKLERLIQEGKIECILNSDPHSKANIFYTVRSHQHRTMSTKWRNNYRRRKNHWAQWLSNQNQKKAQSIASSMI